MSFFHLDEKKCRHDGICTEVCPVGILRMDEKTNLPFVIEGGEDLCINCGHCLSVCPHGAISLSHMPVEECEPLDIKWNLLQNEMAPFLKGRRSIRVYEEKKVDKKLIESLIDIARYAPSGINLQPVSWKVLYEPEKVQDLAAMVIQWMRAEIESKSPLAQHLRFENSVKAWDKKEDRICRKAPHLVMAYGLAQDMTALGASTIALTYFDLMAAASGLGACWAGYVHMAANKDPLIRKFLHLRSRESCYGAMLFGFPKYKYSRIPQRNPVRITWL